jgi:hypothetical protein
LYLLSAATHCLGWWKEHKDLPTVEQVKNVWNFDLERPTQQQRDLLLWWVDIFLPKIAGPEWFDEDHRHYQLMSDKCTYNKFTRVAVPASTEAFAMAAFENWRTKWMLQFQFQDENPHSGIPRGRGNEKYEDGKWSTPRMGQKAYGGWTDVGIDAFVAYDQQVVDFRKEEENNGRVKQLFALDLMRRAHNKTAPSAAEEGKKKRKPTTAQDFLHKPKKIALRDDE